MRNFFILLFWLTSLQLFSQESFKYTDGHLLNLRGSSFFTSNDYDRIDSVQRKKLPPAVQSLAQNSAGLNINFETNATCIRVNWELDKFVELWNMTPVAVNGLDLYALKNGKWQYVASARPQGNKNSVLLIDNLNGDKTTYRLHLPLYSKLTKLKVGVPVSADIAPADKVFSLSEKIAIYGSSITQGASASRPGMAYPSIIARKLGVETINLGFSGSAKMEIEMAEILANISADVYILDCVPNASPEQIKQRAVPFVRLLRKKRPDVRIIMVESIYRETAHWNIETKKRVESQNEAFKKAYEILINENAENLFYITSDNLIGDDHESTIDGTHLTDLGFMRFADEIITTLKKILYMDKISFGY